MSAGTVLSPGNLTCAFSHGAPVATTPDIVTTVAAAVVEPGAGVKEAGVEGEAEEDEVESAAAVEPSPQPASTSAIAPAAARLRNLENLYTATPLMKNETME